MLIIAEMIHIFKIVKLSDHDCIKPTNNKINDLWNSLNVLSRNASTVGSYDLNILNSIPQNLNVPLIFAGGAGNYKHFIHALENKRIDAVATANLFNFINDGLKIARINLSKKFNFPNWKSEKIIELENFFKN